MKAELHTAIDAAGTDESLRLFLMEAIAAIDPDDLSRQDPETLIGALQRSHQFLFEGTLEKTRIYATAPNAPGAPLVLDIICPDMAFIVDSALAALRAMGGEVQLFAHPVVHVSLGRVSAAGGLAMSVLHIHSAPVADVEALVAELAATLQDVAWATQDWQPILERVQHGMAGLQAHAQRQNEEALNFLDWLIAHNFAFLGLREYRLDGGVLAPVPGSGLGILRDDDVKVVRSGAEYVESTPQLVSFAESDEPLLVTKANRRTRVHRRTHMDYVGIKLFDDAGTTKGELRVVGLYTAQAHSAPHIDVPIVRRKIAEVMRRSGVDPLGHAGRTLLSALDSYPRDELFQIETGQLAEFAHAIAGLYDRPRVRVLPRIDCFDNFVSILTYVPRDRYDGTVRARITRYLAEVYDGRVSAFYPHFPEGELVRLHVIVGRNGGVTPQPDRRELEAAVEALTRDFSDMLAAAASEPGLISDWRQAFSPAYQSRSGVNEALQDIAIFAGLEEDGVGLRLGTAPDGGLSLRVYHEGTAIPLSDRVPVLEAFGFRVIDERTHVLVPRDGVERYLHDMVLDVGEEDDNAVLERATSIEAGLAAVWRGDAESDRLNSLVTFTELDWSQAALLRALSRYLRQIGISYSQRYLAQVLVTQRAAAQALVALFEALHNPGLSDGPQRADAERAAIAAELEKISSLDEDNIVRRFQNLIEASLRTNNWQRDARGAKRPALAIKFDSHKIEGMAEPRPYREISVYSPRIEGVHLRFGAIARGGLRWSDRPEDFRTEVLGLVKAQQVKNAVIVPVGAKGGFVPKHVSTGMPRDAYIAEGTESYRIFIGALLDVTDNLVDNIVLPPDNLVRRDGDDPYLVVAADKGTASFSDLANSIAIERGFWLGDAFASGGSAGYDHKKMAITARGAWEAVKRHFREMDRDIQAEAFTVAGVGDMSGDVFGNGMLLSPQIRLVAAFDHRDIFIDPAPDAAVSFAERQRLFALPRSSWQDFDKTLISKGGGVFSRSLKSIPLSAEIKSLLGVDQDTVTPAEVMKAILTAPVDLLWFGGIGTYIKAEAEDHAAVGDRANDAIRVNGEDVRAKVVGEGANLGVSQRGRIAYARTGGRIDTDAIDNSAGVNSSDLEVNIKIALAPVLASGQLEMAARNDFLAAMTDALATLCLRNNYLQSLALSLAERAGVAELPDHRVLIEGLEARGLLDRRIEFLPNDAALDQLSSSGKGLTRPELAVILAYAKLTLFDDLLAGSAIDDPYLAGELFRYFPEALHDAFPEAVEGHRLRREIIATVLTNAMINRGGPAFVSELTAATSASPGEVALAFAAVRDSYGLKALNAAIDGLDGKVPGVVQLELYGEVEALLRQQSLWFLRNTAIRDGLAGLIERHRDGVEKLSKARGLLPPEQGAELTRRIDALKGRGVPSELARLVGELPFLGHSSDIVLVAERSGAELETAARAYFGVAGLFDLFRIIAGGRAIMLSDRFERMALDRAMANVMRALRDLASDALAAGSIEDFVAQRSLEVSRTMASVKMLTEGELTVSRLSVAAGLLTDLARET
ncbi:NAD-glutamate dehydrogenase [Devosia sp. CC-YST696]|nr:NAD-glutamate dehydrogenase [Devosia faecipullorum]